MVFGVTGRLVSIRISGAQTTRLFFFFLVYLDIFFFPQVPPKKIRLKDTNLSNIALYPFYFIPSLFQT